MAEQEKAFDPSAHLSKLTRKKKVDGGWVEVESDYLEVKWRLAWLRDSHPDADIETVIVRDDPEQAVFRAKVSIPERGSATGYGSETKGDFGDFIEKAETKALGRALAALGFGTQFCDDFDEGGAVTDSPVERQAPRPARSSFAKPTDGKKGGVSDAQMKYLFGGDDGRAGLLFTRFEENKDRVEWLERHCPDALGIEEGEEGDPIPVLSLETVKKLGSMQASDLISQLKDMGELV